MSHLSKFRIFWKPFHVFLIKNEVLSGEQEKVSIMSVRVGEKIPSLAITDYHHSASLVMPICDPRDGFFSPTLTLMMDTYIVIIRSTECEGEIESPSRGSPLDNTGLVDKR